MADLAGYLPDVGGGKSADLFRQLGLAAGVEAGSARARIASPRTRICRGVREPLEVAGSSKILVVSGASTSWILAFQGTATAPTISGAGVPKLALTSQFLAVQPFDEKHRERGTRTTRDER